MPSMEKPMDNEVTRRTVATASSSDGTRFALIEDCKEQHVFVWRDDDAESQAVFSECSVGSITARDVAQFALRAASPASSSVQEAARRAATETWPFVKWAELGRDAEIAETTKIIMRHIATEMATTQVDGPQIDFKKYASNYEKEFSSWIGDGTKVYNLGDCAIIIWHNIITPLRNRIKELEAATTPQSEVRVMGDEWRDISSAPKDGQTVLLGYENLNGKWRTLRGQWFSEQAILDEWEDPAEGSEGWYETSAQADDPPNCWLVYPTHWQPLPSLPKLNSTRTDHKD